MVERYLVVELAVVNHVEWLFTKKAALYSGGQASPKLYC